MEQLWASQIFQLLKEHEALAVIVVGTFFLRYLLEVLKQLVDLINKIRQDK